MSICIGDTFDFEMTPKARFSIIYLADKIMNDYVPALWKLLIREKHIESLSVCMGGEKCKYHNNHSSHSNQTRSLV